MGGSRVIRRVLVATALAVVFVVSVVPATYASAYNQGSKITTDLGWGNLSTDARLQYQGAYANSSVRGPHGGYDTTTNKCKDCHSVHYAFGSYMLLRANSRQAACDFCHGGGGGSTVNIMMDNSYSTGPAAMALAGGPAADATTTMGLGTGHTLGYKGNAPDDIRPAFSDPNGFACFDCHTPHGNSARSLGPFFAPGAPVQATELTQVFHLRFNPGFVDPNTGNLSLDPVEVLSETIPTATARYIEYINLTPPGHEGEDGWYVEYGIEARENYVIKQDLSGLGIANRTDAGPTVIRKPLMIKGTYLLLKDPDNENGLGEAGDLSTATVNIGGKEVYTSRDTSHTSNKLAIDWENPLGAAQTIVGNSPAASPSFGPAYDPTYRDPYNSFLNVFYTGNNERFAWPYFLENLTENRPGVATEGEFCADCHSGAAGMSKQAAEVWRPDRSDSSTGTYMIGYGHDSQPRGCDRQLYLNPEDNNNFGPECRACHTGASSCGQCHADPNIWNVSSPNEPAWDTSGTLPLTEGSTTYQANPSFRNAGRTVYTTISPSCLDGGFSFPHRTLGRAMLKDSLFGIDFDGKQLAPGQIRGAGLSYSSLEQKYDGDIGDSFSPGSLTDTRTQSLDSVCIDCHGDATYWNGDNASYEMSFTVPNEFYLDGYRTTGGSAPEWSVSGWDLLLKGLP